MNQPWNITITHPQWRRHFALCLLVALGLHVSLIMAVRWVVPALPAPADTSFIALKVKFGTAETGEGVAPVETAPPAPAEDMAKDAAEEPPAPKVLTKGAEVGAPPVQKSKTTALEKPSKQVKAAPQKPRRKAINKAPAPTAGYLDQQVRITPSNQVVEGEEVGNSQQEAQRHATRYTQEISLWINQFKIYPDQARQAGMEGVVKIWLTIDRRGNILNQVIHQPAPYPMLDKLAMDAVRRANPVPAVPMDYPDQSPQLAFIVPLKFKIK